MKVENLPALFGAEMERSAQIFAGQGGGFPVYPLATNRILQNIRPSLVCFSLTMLIKVTGIRLLTVVIRVAFFQEKIDKYANSQGQKNISGYHTSPPYFH
jgi:hypothetical protein